MKCFNPIEFVFLAEFDIDEGSILKHSYPPLNSKEGGIDEHLLAEHMLPDGAHDRNEDWTIFYLNQIPGLTLDSNQMTRGEGQDGQLEGEADRGIGGSNLKEEEEEEEKNNNKIHHHSGGELLYVMSLVRTKKVATVRRGALVKALAVATRFPYIQIYKPILLLALDDYFNDPSLTCLSRLYTAINSIDLNHLPNLSLNERLILRTSDRKDLFEEKFTATTTTTTTTTSGSTASNSQFEFNTATSGTIEAFSGLQLSQPPPGRMKRDTSIPSSLNRSSELKGGDTSEILDQFNNNTITTNTPTTATSTSTSNSMMEIGMNHRRSISSSNSMSSKILKDLSNLEDLPPSWRSTKSRSNTIGSSNEEVIGGTSGSYGNNKSEGGDSIPSSSSRKLITKDTHFFESRINYNGIILPMRIPLGTFPQEIGDYSLIKLIQTFSTPTSLTPSPLHPHLHTNGLSTHPIILLFNALLTNKRIIFLGHGLPASDVANLVLAACALGSGCGTVLGGFGERAFPYTNLTNLDGLQTVEGFIAGVCNPAFLNRPSWWDVLLNIETGKIIISKEIALPVPSPSSTSSSFSFSTSGTPLAKNISLPPLSRSTTSNTGGGGGQDEMMMMDGGGGSSSTNGKGIAPGLGPKDIKAESADTYFMEEILNAIQSHYGESVIRARFTDYTHRFIRLASLYEETYISPSSYSSSNIGTEIGYPSYGFNSNLNPNRLGSGIVFMDDAVKLRELNLSRGRIEGWRITKGYQLFKEQFRESTKEGTVASRFDLLHQISRLRQGRKMPTNEVELILRTLALESKTEEGLLAILAYLPPHFGGLLPITFGLFHPSEKARKSTLNFLDTVNQSDTGKKFIQSLNAFHRSAYERQSKERLSQSFATTGGGGLSNHTSPIIGLGSPHLNNRLLQDRRPSFTTNSFS